MNNDMTLQQVSEYSKRHRRRKRWQSVVTVMAAVVVFVTTYALILPAITLVNDPTCGFSEHAHTDECFTISDDGEKTLLCEVKEHTHHEIACYADFSADVETKEDWEATLQDLNLIGEWHRDVLAIAKSQLDYAESRDNLILNDEGKLSGYTRYGEWYGNPYGDWSAMFASFCLNYAGVTNMPLDSDVNAWISTLSEEKYDFYRTAGDHVPTCGEVVFLDKDKDGTPDEAGIVAQIIPDIDGKGAKIKVIEGDSSNKVQYVMYEYNSEMIIGYSILPDGMYKEQTVQAEIFTDGTYENAYDFDDVVIKVSGMLPKDGKVYAYPVTLNTEETICAYDITIFDSDGNVFEPLVGNDVKVSFISDKLKSDTFPDGIHPEVYYLPEDGEAERIPSSNTDDGIEFSANHFSLYAVEGIPETSAGNFKQLKEAIEKNSKLYIRLTASISTESRLDIQNKNIIIDLNGFELTINTNKFKDNAMFQLNSDGNLTIVDSKEYTETKSAVNSSEPSYGNKATLSVSNNNATLTYYVTETELVNRSTGQTAETLYKHTVSGVSGAVVGNGYPIVTVNGGTFTLQSGMLRSGTNRAVYQTSGTTNITGGYICGFSNTNSDFGGAIYASNGTVNISGSAVIAANTAKCGGAIVLNDSNAKLNISGGVISGNTATHPNDVEGNNGGGIYVNNGTVTMSDGYITNNTATGSNYYDGGGGVFLFDSDSKFEISGGYVTANKAHGGGGLKTKDAHYATFNMSGGFFSGNLSTDCEGGGIAIEYEGRGTLTGGYITNNYIEKTKDWGGGGFFCADKAEIYMYNLLVTNNTAGGFGGGVAGCPTGKLTLYVNSGCAVFDNDDIVYDGEVNWVSGGTKDGKDFEKCKEVFQSHGHADYFCANQSAIFGTMLGNGSAEWEGSADGIPVTAGKGDVVTATSVMGLKSHASEEDKQNAMAVAKLYINGNHSYTHGGGIMCNGVLIIGEAVDFEASTRAQFQAQKVLYKGGTNKELPLDDYNFTFKLVKDYLNGEVLETVKCNSKGYLSFHNGLKFSENGTYVYYIMEVPDEKTNTILFDNSIYEVKFDVKRDNGTEFNGKTKYTYQITNMSINKSTDGGKTWSNVDQTSTPQGESVIVPLAKRNAFVNRTMEFTKLTVKKEWDGGVVGANSVTVLLKQNGVEYNRVTLNASNGWSYTWNNLPAGYSYTVEELPVAGYKPSYNVVPGKTSTVQKQLENDTYWVPATSIQLNSNYIIVSPDGTKALCVKRDDDVFTASDTADVAVQFSQMTMNGKKYNFWMDDDITVAKGAIFTPQSRPNNGGFALMSDIGNSWLLAQDAGGNHLKSTNAIKYSSLAVYQNGYLKINYEFDGTPNDLRTVIFEDESGKFNTIKADASRDAVLFLTQAEGTPTVYETILEDATIVITNTGTPGYKLPETGGGGTFMYIAAGMALITLGAYLAYKKLKGGKEDSASF